jgi:hypothetical protein
LLGFPGLLPSVNHSRGNKVSSLSVELLVAHTIHPFFSDLLQALRFVTGLNENEELERSGEV